MWLIKCSELMRLVLNHPIIYVHVYEWNCKTTHKNNGCMVVYLFIQLENLLNKKNKLVEID